MKKLFALMGLSAAVFLVSCTKPSLKDVKVKSEREKNLYALGIKYGAGLRTFNLTEEDAILIARGLYDQSRGNVIEGLDSEERSAKVQAFLAQRQAERFKEAREMGADFMEDFIKDGGKKTPSGLAYKVLKAGRGAVPSKKDIMVLRYKASLIDGTVFSESDPKNGPVMMSLDQLYQGWAEGMTLMKAGGKMKFVIPPTLAFGDNGSPPLVPGGATVVLEVELLDVSASNQ
jgi:FKBP-type peptidyl-prolyl cis-trans isomerase FkpA